MLKCVIMCEKKQVLSIGKQPFLPQNMLSLAHIGLAGSFGVLVVVWLVVVVRGLYLTRHLFTLSPLKMWSRIFFDNLCGRNEASLAKTKRNVHTKHINVKSRCPGKRCSGDQMRSTSGSTGSSGGQLCLIIFVPPNNILNIWKGNSISS